MTACTGCHRDMLPRHGNQALCFSKLLWCPKNSGMRSEAARIPPLCMRPKYEAEALPASQSLRCSPSMSSPPPSHGEDDLEKPVSTQHGPRSWTVLSIRPLAMTRERSRSVHARREEEEVRSECLASVHCLVFECWPNGVQRSPLRADPKMLSIILTGSSPCSPDGKSTAQSS